MAPTEPYGTTPFPILSSDTTASTTAPLRVTFNPLELQDTVTPQQPQTQQIAVFEAKPSEESLHGAAVLAVNQHFVCYAVKNGLIRVLHRHSTLRSLLRAHVGQRVTDIEFFQDGDVLATAASPGVVVAGAAAAAGKKSEKISKNSSIVIWRVFERSPEIMSEKLLEIETDKFTISRVLWHPFNPNQFWMIHQDGSPITTSSPPTITQSPKNVATLVETTRITTIPHPQEQHAVCSFFQNYCIMEGAMQLKTAQAGENLTDLCWNGRDTRYVLAVYDSGRVILWDVKIMAPTPDPAIPTVTPMAIGQVQEDSAVTRCLFLPHEDAVNSSTTSTTATSWTTCFVTATQNNATLTLWSAWSSEKAPTKLQIISIAGGGPNTSFILDVCFGPAPPDASPPSCFVVAADREEGRVFAYHCRAVWSQEKAPKKALLAGCDYVVPFATKHPTYSWSVVCAPTQDISEEELSEQGGLIFDMKLFSYQATVVQCLTLTSYMCLPPSSTWTDPTPGVAVESASASTTNATTDMDDDAAAALVSDIGSNDGDDAVQYDEDYDVEDDDCGAANNDDDDYDGGAPEPSALPNPVGGGAPLSAPPGLSANPFANWLGAIAAKTTTSGQPPPPLPLPSSAPASSAPPLPPPANVPPPQLPPSFLSPMDILGNAGKQEAEPPAPLTSKKTELNSRDPTPTATNKQQQQQLQSKQQQQQQLRATEKKLAPKKNAGPKVPKFPPQPDGKISILKRDEAAAETTTSETPLPTPSVAAATPPPVATTGNVEEVVRRVVREEMRATVIPSIRQAIQDAKNNADTHNKPLSDEGLAQALVPLQSSLDTLSKQGVQVDNERIANTLSDAVHEPIRAAFADSMKTVLIPTLESITGQVFVQISEQLGKKNAATDNNNKETSKEMESMSKQLSTMTALVAKLTDEVQNLRREVAAATANQVTPSNAPVPVAGQPAPHVPPVDPLQARRNEILALLRERQYEQAFTKAVSASTADLVVFCCRNADLTEVLGGSTPVLSQPILLCLMQQLGTVLTSTPHNSTLQLEMDWLQEIALSLNPADPSIHRHVPGVFQQVVNNINQKLQMLQGSDQHQLRRQLQRMLQLMRGMSMGA